MELRIVYGLPDDSEEIETLDLIEDLSADSGLKETDELSPKKKRGQRQKTAPAYVIR